MIAVNDCCLYNIVMHVCHPHRTVITEVTQLTSSEFDHLQLVRWVACHTGTCSGPNSGGWLRT